MSGPHKDRKVTEYLKLISQVPGLDHEYQPPLLANIMVQAEEATEKVFIDEYFFKGDDKKILDFNREAVIAGIEAWTEHNSLTPSEFERIFSYHSAESFDAEVRAYAMEHFKEPTLDTIRLITKEDDVTQRSKVIARFFFKNPGLAQDHSLAPIGKLAELNGFEYVLLHELTEIDDKQFLMVFLQPNKNRSILNLLYQRLNDDVKTRLKYQSPSHRNLIQYLKDKAAILESKGDSATASAIQSTLDHWMENGALKKTLWYLTQIAH